MKDLKVIKSHYSVKETTTRLSKAIQEEGWHIFAQINHDEEAAAKGLDLRPTKVLLFGNPKIGTLLMQNAQSSAIDLPMKVLIMEDTEKRVSVVYNDLDLLKQRHNLTDENTLQEIANMVEKVCHFAAHSS